MNILCCLDDNYVQHTSVMLTSFFINNDFEHHNIYVITMQLNDGNVAYLREVVNKYHSNFYLYQVNEAMLSGFVRKETDYVSLAAYLRLFSTQVLPFNCSKVLYIDGDIVVRKSLEELWKMDIENYAVAAVDETIKANCIRHNYDVTLGYFNSGFMLINLSFWRENSVAEKAIDYMKRFPERIKSWDQAALNGILYGGLWKRLDLKYNLTTIFLCKQYVEGQDFPKIYTEEYNSAISHPAVVHYTGPDKPWKYTVVDHPFKKDYLQYARMLGINHDFNISIFFKRIVRKLLCATGVLKNSYVSINNSICKL